MRTYLFSAVVVAADHSLRVQRERTRKDGLNELVQVVHSKIRFFGKHEPLCNGFDHVDNEHVANDLEERCFAMSFIAEVDDSSSNAMKEPISLSLGASM